MRDEKDKVLAEYLPQRVIEDYRLMKESECLTQTLTPRLRTNYSVDKVIYKLTTLLLNIKNIIK